MNQRRVQAVIFDFGGVMVAGDQAIHEAIAAQVNLPAADVNSVFSSRVVVDGWDRVRVGGLSLDGWFADVRRLCAAEFGTHGEVAFRCWAEIPPPPNDGVLDLIRRLHGRYRLAVLSNADERLETYLADHLGIAHCFDVVVNSSREGFAKPDERIYRVTLDRLGVEPHTAVFVDDVAHNVTAAEAAGIAGVRFVDHERLVGDLRSLGIDC